MQWEVEPTGARIAQLATDLTARIDALDPESDTPVYSDFTFSIAVADWTLANGVYTARVNNAVLLTENAGIQVFYDASLRTGLTGDIFADKHTGYIDFTTTLQPVGPISGIIRVLDSVSGMLSVAKGGTGAATPKKARENLDTPIRDIPVDFGTVSSLPQTIYDADITANMVAFDAAFGNPAAVPGGIDVTFAAGSVTISGTMVSGQETTIKFWCHEQRTSVEGTESGSAEPRVNEFVHVGAQTLTVDQQAQIRTNLGAASASDVETKATKTKLNLRKNYVSCATTAEIENAVATQIAEMDSTAQSSVIGVTITATGQKLAGGIWNGLLFKGDGSYYSCLFYGYAGELRQYVYLSGTKNWYKYTPTTL